MNHRRISSDLTRTSWGPTSPGSELTGVDSSFTAGPAIFDHLENRLSRDGTSFSGRLAGLPQVQGQLSDALALGEHQLRQNSDRLQNVVIEANHASRAVVTQQLRQLGIEIPFLEGTSGVRGAGRSPRFERSSLTRQRHENSLITPQQARDATDILDRYVKAQAMRGEQVRHDIGARTHLTFSQGVQWLEFFRVALEVAQGQQRHEIEQGLRLVEARQRLALAGEENFRENSRLQLMMEESAHRRRIESRNAEVSNYVQRRRCDTETYVMVRDSELRERAEQHNFDIGRETIELQKRRNDQEFVSAIIGQALTVAKGALLWGAPMPSALTAATNHLFPDDSSSFF